MFRWAPLTPVQVLVGAMGETMKISDHAVKVTLPNPFFESYGAIDDLVPPEEQDVGSDTLFPKTTKTVCLENDTGLESILLKR